MIPRASLLWLCASLSLYPQGKAAARGEAASGGATRSTSAPNLTQADEVAALMAKHWEGLTTLKARFRESYRGQVRRGELVFKKPALMHVRYLAADGSCDMELVVNQKKLFVYLKAVNVVSEQDLTAEAGAGELVGQGVLNTQRLTRLYHFNFVDAKKPMPMPRIDEGPGARTGRSSETLAWNVTLTPRDITQGLERLELWVDEEGAVRRVKARTIDDRLIELAYFELRRNETVGDKEFEFDVPASAQVVKNALLRADRPEGAK